ncbi:hypothetical protein ACHHYP_13670 [Achlya hypogyna]|uniref:FAD-binding FR-type domain-containing protein n=1 Tax=Achlya hypogyna TaxID=1202772 RepID=A0A1V9YEX6_ACHHY|nr:hypothetical protein ACHHYP_13670 [Achlya hypogyna]
MAPKAPLVVDESAAGIFHEASTPVAMPRPMAKNPPRQSGLSLVAHWAIGLLLAFSVFAVTVYYMPIRDPVTLNVLNKWFNVDPKKKGSGHSEMTMPTYFFFGVVLPVLVSFLLVRFVTKGVPAPVPHVSHWLQRKPRFVYSLVSYGEILFLIVVVVGNILFFYYFYSARVNAKSTYDMKISVAAKTLGFSCLYNMAFLALPATRHCFWMEWLGIPYAHGIKYHRWLGIATILTLFFHMVFYIKDYANDDDLLGLLPCFNCDIGDKGRQNWVNAFGWLSGIAMFAMGVTSLPFIRRRFYNVFYVTHLLFLPAAYFAVLHWGNIVFWLFTTMVLYIVNRMMSSATIQAPVVVQKAAAYPHEVTELTFEVATSYQAGDVVYLKVPAVSKTQWHPFSVASTPLHTPGSLTVYIKTLGKWSGQVHEYVRQCVAAGVDPVVYMDGGYVSPALVPASYEKVVFIGGGIGVTPLMAQILHVLYTQPHQEVHLIWHVRDIHMMAQFQQWFHEVTAISSRLHLHLHVTQKSAASAAAPVMATTTFDLKAPSVPARPYTNLPVWRQVLLMTLAFLFSGGLLVIVHYGNKIQQVKASYWPLQRFVEFVVMVVGAYWAYVVVLVKPFLPVTGIKVDNVAKEPVMSLEAFAERYEVKYSRMDWVDFFTTLSNGAEKVYTPKIGVYVSGPKTLSRAIDAVANTPLYAVHHEEFEMSLFPVEDIEPAAFYNVSTPQASSPFVSLHTKPPTIQPWARAAHAFVAATAIFCVFAWTVYYTPMVTLLNTNTLNVWWKVNPKVKGSGHSEMSQYTYAFFGFILPTLVAFVVVRFLPRAPLPQLSSVLHRKPALLRYKVSIGEILFLLVIVGGNIIFFYYYYNGRIKPKNSRQDNFEVAAHTLGYSAFYNLVFAALPATRHCFWMEWLNIPYAHGIKYHQWLAMATIICSVVHCIGYIEVYAVEEDMLKLLPCFNCDIATTGQRNWVNFFGGLTLACFLVMAMTALPYVRRHHFRVFSTAHLLFVPAGATLCMHNKWAVIWLFAAIVIYVANRVLSLATVRAPVVVHKALAHPTVTELSVACSTAYTPGDVVFVKVPAISGTEWHPFSVASSPLHSPGTLTLYMKALGPWTRSVRSYIGQCNAAGVAPTVYMDGGYRSPALLSPTFEKVVFVAGGIGATPLLGYILHTLHAAPHQHVHFIWHARDVELFQQFHQWFVEAASVAGPGQLHVTLHVTDDTAITTVDAAPAQNYNLTAPTTTPRPFTNLSTLHQVLVMLMAFACSGALLVIVHYGNKIQTSNAKLWPLQRFVEYCVVIAGAMLSYFVVLVTPYKWLSNTAKTERPEAPTMTAAAFAAHYNVQHGRADWAKYFDGLKDPDAACGSIGVFVSGPKSLSEAVDTVAQTAAFTVRHEVFQL